MRYAIVVLLLFVPSVTLAQKNKVAPLRDGEHATGYYITTSGKKEPLKYATLNHSDLKNKKNHPFVGVVGPRTNLSNAELSGAHLWKAALTRANLTNANLVGCPLDSANLLQANLEGAILLKANLNDADLSGANISGAVLTGISFNNNTNWDGVWYYGDDPPILPKGFPEELLEAVRREE